MELEGDLLLNFARNRYLDKTPIDIFQSAWHTRMGKLRELIEECHADGVIWYQLAFDEIYDMEHTCVSKWIAETGVPLMKLESSYEYSREAIAPLTTRLESFVESLKEAK